MGGYYCLFPCLLVCFLLHTLGSHSLNQTCNPTDLEALLSFSSSLDRKGSRLVGWGPNDTACCSWTGVSCDLGRVVGLDLSNKSLHGGISSAISLLDGLVTLNLSGNSLHGQPPVGLGRLARMRILDLSMNMLSGAFPTSEHGFPAIEVVNVSFNQFKGPHPVFPGAMNLTVLDISSNAFSGGINIMVLCVAPVKALRFSRNKFTGQVLTGFGQCKMLTELSIDSSGLTGNLPSDLYTISELRRLSLRDNLLSGNLGENLGNFSQLIHIDLSYNMFRGIIPDMFGGLRRLEFLNLCSNLLTGTLPASLSSCPMLRVINLRNNSLSGKITIDFRLLPRLIVLDAGANMLSGPIPPDLMWCTELRTLNLGKNMLDGDITESFKNLRSLSHLSLDRNGFTNLSSALRVLQHLPKLTTLVLTKNFHGGETLPMDGINGFKSMQVFVLANCALSGMIPPWLKSMESLRALDLSWNKLNGKIPLWLGNLNDLFYVDLSNNLFSGELPESFTQMKGLISSNSSSEHASMEDFPLFIKKNSCNKGLQYNHVSSFPPSLILSNNLLVGPVLWGLGNLVKLHVLDLGWNNLSGSIPDELSTISSLEELNLTHNGLSGSIPESLAKLTFLSTFDVSYNNLTGLIPAGGQFSTFTNENFVGNAGLCLRWNGPCFGKAPFEEGSDGTDTISAMLTMTYITVEVGFAFGLLTVCNILFFARAWRAAYFLAVDRFFDKLYVMTMVKVNKLTRIWEDKDHL
ncbi:hypothetical protein CFC21_019980 [Triticum aestivum]|uniref:Leucine-rich repeat-containing N-terminal plant-type domain-containing protein n=3 Tax=Triticum TaxID=4564 RepID=A0A9R1REW0_TRITD|nr:phytosulfokine receptor 1-like [Triticum aestivum]XP_044459665.1 phytosulfokine receptor 1-like [Triticum aestivum]KAF7004805.1 hypothetical protein CFC21_019980 [Triticum aestivum]VAH38754.1 unnamed protein product [Triticum turgidum subsp. durum]